jgi:hypothetical protein
MELVENFKRNRAIKSYIRKLPSLLAKDYGRSNTYTPKQVKRTIQRYGLSVADAGKQGVSILDPLNSFSYTEPLISPTGESGMP